MKEEEGSDPSLTPPFLPSLPQQCPFAPTKKCSSSLELVPSLLEPASSSEVQEQGVTPPLWRSYP